MDSGRQSEGALIGKAIERLEDAALLTGAGRYMDDLPVAPGTLHAAILRSPHAHAELLAIDRAAALAMPGVAAVVTREEVRRWTRPFTVGVKQPMEHWCLAVDRVRYVGEPVAVVLAEDRYRAEDALEKIAVEYRPLPAVVDSRAAAAAAAPVLHPAVGGNIVSDRRFRYGDPDAAFAAASHRIALTVDYPRNAVTPIECLGVLAQYFPADDVYEATSSFMGPFALHPVMALALKVPANRLRLKTPPESGGSFGVRQSVFPYVVLMSVAARAAGRPVKWIEDRLEHLVGATSATNRVTTLEAAVSEDGEIAALRWDQLEDCGAYLRAPEPATIYRMHGNMSGAYRLRHLDIRNRVVLTNKTPSGLVRGFGGPQVYFPLERLMQRIARTLGLDPLEVIRRNLVPAGAFPYRCPAGALLDSGDFARAIDIAVAQGGLAELKRRQQAARAEGRLYGIGYAAVVEPSISNMGYITTVLTPEERRKAGPKSGAQATATVSLDPLGGVSVHVASVPQGQGHRTVLAQVVGEVLGLAPSEIRVIGELDTGKDAWSIASGNYSSRFAGAVAGAAHLAATRLRDKLVRIAAPLLNVATDEIAFAKGRIFAAGNPDNALSFSRVAGASHWAPQTLGDGVAPALRETAFWTPPVLEAPNEAEEINSSAAYGFIFDCCGVEVERETGRVRIDKYVTMHDAGRLLNPALADGQVLGGFANAVGAALTEHFAYGEDGSFLSGTFADYLVPTACEVPEPLILHLETPSPVTPLGAKGVGEGNCMSTPVCLANAVADALGVDDIALPMTPARLMALIEPEEPAPAAPPLAPPAAGKGLSGSGVLSVPAPPEEIWSMLLDPKALAALLPGCEALERTGENAYHARLRIGIGPVRGRYEAKVRLFDLEPPRALRLRGEGIGALGSASGEGAIALAPEGTGTRVSYRYSAAIAGKVAAVGGRMLDGAARLLIDQFFERLIARSGGAAPVPLWRRLLRLLRLAR
ncbi:MAG TPA: molybdopterin cofactor-binding domain-containing protein [Stellaceae bacterium]|nr:molybdopterin cofactor-binding domain-containing protein [Stellaceae bacterium]